MQTPSPIVGPRVPEEELRAHRARYRGPTLCFLGAIVALVASLFLPYWILELQAPQFPQGLRVQAYVNRLVGDVDPVTNSNDLDQLDELNHYVGMPPLDEGATLERSVSIMAIIVFVGLLVAATYIHSKWVLLLALPAVAFPFVFLVDLQFWLWNYGHSLDPRAPLSGAVGEFTPHLFGPSKIAQFDTNALPGPGLALAFLAAGLTAVGLWLHRRAYKPLIDAEVETEPATELAAGGDARPSGLTP
jgi:hypothetical protein